MEDLPKSCTMCRKDFRKLLKKKQRKKRRQKFAKKLASQLKIEEKKRLKDPQYQWWLNEQKELEQREKLQLKAEEQAWLQREAIAQQQFERDRQRLKKEEVAKEQLKLEQKEYIERIKKKQNEEKRVEAETANAFEHIMQRMEEYLSNSNAQAPPELRKCLHSRPNQQLCSIYERTNCCRYGLSCQMNHRSPMLSTILLIRNFFKHPLLKQNYHVEYDSADTSLELTERDLREDYDAFFADVTDELQRFGKILNFRTVRNLPTHLCGNVYVEYTQERSALNAFINLQGRWYAGKKINIEFSNLNTWRGAVCGLSLKRKCTKGKTCNYLHLLQNPDNKYNTLLEYTKLGLTRMTPTTANKTISATAATWDDEHLTNHKEESRNWRWSESPEPRDIEKQTVSGKIVCRSNVSKNAEFECSTKNSHENAFKVQHLSSQRKKRGKTSINRITTEAYKKDGSTDKSHKKLKIEDYEHRTEKNRSHRKNVVKFKRNNLDK